jgi:hypothetical protein
MCIAVLPSAQHIISHSTSTNALQEEEEEERERK